MKLKRELLIGGGVAIAAGIIVAHHVLHDSQRIDPVKHIVETADCNSLYAEPMSEKMIEYVQPVAYLLGRPVTAQDVAKGTVEALHCEQPVTKEELTHVSISLKKSVTKHLTDCFVIGAVLQEGELDNGVYQNVFAICPAPHVEFI